MLYRIRATGAVLTQGEVRGLHPNTSFPAVWDASTCEAIGVDPVLPSPQPSFLPFKTYLKDGAEQDALGNWVEKWLILDWDAAKIAEVIAEEWNIVRDRRNEKLAASDWTQLADAPVNKELWATYRQTLRDITTQPDPFDIFWPSAPL